MTPSLTAEGVALAGRLEAAHLDLDQPQLIAVIGPNGSGKTSLLRALAGIERTGGKVWIDGERLDQAVPARRRALMAFLPASREVSWPISVRDVIALGLDRVDPDRVERLVDLLELRHLAMRPVDRISTGERSRALLARALASRPSLLLLDEPLSNLDPYWVLRTLEIMRTAVAEGALALVSLHDLTMLPRFDRVLLMDRGRIVAQGEPAEVKTNPAFEQAFRVRATGGGWALVD